MNKLIEKRNRMIGAALIAMLLMGVGTLLWWSHVPQVQASNATEAEAKARVAANYGKLPLAFEPNRGQTDESVEYLSRGEGYSLYLSGGEATLALHRPLQHKDKEKPSSDWLKLHLLGANAAPSAEAFDQLEGKANYLIGNDRSQWQTDVPTYRQVKYHEVWPGVDMVWYGNQHTLEYDFIVQPGADTKQIKLVFEGAQTLRLDDAGNLVLMTAAGELLQHAPVVYQNGEQGRDAVAGKYVLNEQREVSFALGAYDASRPLVIDPQLLYATYVGGTLLEVATAVAVDAASNAYLIGTTLSTNFPVKGALQGQKKEDFDIFVVKLNAKGTDTVFSTYLGSRNIDAGVDIAVMSNGQACLTGYTETRGTADFPLTNNPFQGNGTFLSCLVGFCRGDDAFVTVLNSAGNGLVYSTYFGGGSTDRGQGIAVDTSGRIFISGSTDSANLPTKNGFQNSRNGLRNDAFLAVFNPTLSGNSSLLYASYLGGSGIEAADGFFMCSDIATDNLGNAYLASTTQSDDLPVKSPAGQSLPPLQASLGGEDDGFIAKFDTESSGAASLTYLTYFGGDSFDLIEAIKVDAEQRAYICGASFSAASSFPLRNAFRSTQTEGEAFVAKLNADGTALFYSSFLGGDGNENALDLALDQAGNLYVTGTTRLGASFLTVNPFAANLTGPSFLTKIEASNLGNTTPRVLYSTGFGGADTFVKGMALDSRGNVILAGVANGNLPVTPGVFQSTHNGAGDGFAAKIASTFPDTIGVFRASATDFLLRNSNTSGNADITLDFGAPGDIAVSGDWDGDGDDEPGVFRPSTSQFILRKNASNLNLCIPPFCTPSTLFTTINFGQSTDLPIVGDWNGDGIDTPGVFRAGLFLLTNGINGQNVNGSAPLPDATFAFGVTGDLPVAGDWDGDGLDTVGIFRLGSWLFTNRLADFNPLEAFQVGFFGAADELPVAGDWNGDGVDTFGVFKNGVFTLTNRFQSFRAAEAFTVNFGQAGDRPVAGDWDGKP